jgi:hypothetical protein
MALFPTNLNSLKSFAFYDTDIKFLKQTFAAYISAFANNKIKIGQNGAKKRKMYNMKVTLL